MGGALPSTARHRGRAASHPRWNHIGGPGRGGDREAKRRHRGVHHALGGPTGASRPRAARKRRLSTMSARPGPEFRTSSISSRRRLLAREAVGAGGDSANAQHVVGRALVDLDDGLMDLTVLAKLSWTWSLGWNVVSLVQVAQAQRTPSTSSSDFSVIPTAASTSWRRSAGRSQTPDCQLASASRGRRQEQMLTKFLQSRPALAKIVARKFDGDPKNVPQSQASLITHQQALKSKAERWRKSASSLKTNSR